MLGLRAYRQPDKSVQRLRDSILPLTAFLVLLDQHFAIEPLLVAQSSYASLLPYAEGDFA